MKKNKKKETVAEEAVLQDNVVEAETSDKQEAAEESVEETLRKQNEALAAEIETLKNDYFKAYADAENLKKRIQREHEQAQKYRIQSFALSILPAIDNLERALQQTSDDSNLKSGVQMIYDQLMSALEAEGVKPIEAVNQVFDPNLHQAMMMEHRDGVEANIVIEELQKGYMLKDRILRASLVKVSE